LQRTRGEIKHPYKYATQNSLACALNVRISDPAESIGGKQMFWPDMYVYM